MSDEGKPKLTFGEMIMKIESEYNGIQHGELCLVWDLDENLALEAYFLGYRGDEAQCPIVVSLRGGGERSFRNAKKIEPKRELKATDLIGWWQMKGSGEVLPVKVSTACDAIFEYEDWVSLDSPSLKSWRFTKDPFIPLDKWLTLDQVREGLS